MSLMAACIHLATMYYGKFIITKQVEARWLARKHGSLIIESLSIGECFTESLESIANWHSICGWSVTAACVNVSPQ